MSSAVPKCIARDVVMTKGISFMYIMSTARVTSPYFSNKSVGNSLYVPITTLDGLVLVVFHFSDPRLGPSISSARIMSAFVIGQFGNILFSTYLIYSLVLGRPIMSWMVRALRASEYSLTVYLFLMLSTVCTNTCAFTLDIREE